MHRDTTAITYYHERWRAAATGIVETAGQTFLLLIAVRALQAGPTAKALLASGASFGLILSLLLVALVAHRRWTPSRVSATLLWISAGSFAVMASFPLLPVITVGGVVALAAANGMLPLQTQIYQDNFPESDRGRRFSRLVMIRVATATVFSDLAGRALSADLSRYRWLLVLYAGAFVWGGICLSRVPSRPLARTEGAHPLHALRFVRHDRVFRLTLISWMLMGFANLMMLPMRVEYLANPRYGLALTTGQVALFVGVIPNVMRLLFSPVWGWAFDRMNFFALRVTLNIGFAVGILAFFTSHSVLGLALGAVCFGFSLAGGDVAWTLWVTKFAPPERVADYMGVHTFFTGLRGVIAPLVAFHIVATLSIGTLGAVSAGLIVLASLVLVREIRFDKAADPGTTLVEKSTEP